VEQHTRLEAAGAWPVRSRPGATAAAILDLQAVQDRVTAWLKRFSPSNHMFMCRHRE